MPGWRHGSAWDSPTTRSPAWAPALMYPRQFTHLDGHNAYEVLGVGPSATRSDIELARRRLAGQVHPDLPTGDAARMSLVNAAAAILLDDSQRDAYDAYLASASPDRRSTPWPVDRTSSLTREQRRDPPRDRQRDPHGDLNRGLFGDPNVVREKSTRRDNGAGDRLAEPPSPASLRRHGSRDGADVHDDHDRRPRPTRGRARGAAAASPRAPSPGPIRRDAGRGAQAWGSEPTRSGSREAPSAETREPGRAQRRRPSPGPSRARTGRSGPMVAPWEDEPYDGPRPALRWQPPPPGPIARWRANRRQARLLARGDRPRRLKAGSPIPVLGLFVMIVAICAIGGAALGYSAASGSSPSPATSPSTPATAPAHPRPSPTGHHK